MSSSKILDDIHESALSAKVHFDAWWALAGEARGVRKVAMNKHRDYFIAAWNAQYTSFFIHFAHLFDRRSDSSSLATYLEKLSEEQGEKVTYLLVEYETLSRRAMPIITARHKTVAHIDVVLTSEEVFLRMNVSWGEVQEILNDTIRFVVKILGAKSSAEIGIPENGRLRDATFRVIDALD